MIRLATVIESFEADLREPYRDRLRPEHLRALAAMKQCRTQASPKMQVQCSGCAQTLLFPHSCGFSPLPHCQHHENGQWLERQLRKQVPAETFLLTFTLPAEFRALARAHQAVVYAALMRCSWDTLRTFAGNDRQLQGTPGAIAVLHTNTRRLDYHPHVHLLMPAAALNDVRKRWRTKWPGKGKGPTLFNHTALARVFRAKMLAAITAAGLSLPERHPVEWIVDCKSVGTGAKALIYLGRYLYRRVISENDIVACADGQVSFRYRDGKTGKTERRTERRTVSGADFLWLAPRHVLPKGFRRARNFGFLHPNCKRLIALPHLLLKFVPASARAWVKPRAPILCNCCGAVMTIVRTRIRSLFAGLAPVPIDAGGAR